MEELVGAIGKLKNGKAGVSSGIQPEMYIEGSMPKPMFYGLTA